MSLKWKDFKEEEEEEEEEEELSTPNKSQEQPTEGEVTESGNSTQVCWTGGGGDGGGGGGGGGDTRITVNAVVAQGLGRTGFPHFTDYVIEAEEGGRWWSRTRLWKSGRNQMNMHRETQSIDMKRTVEHVTWKCTETVEHVWVLKQ